MDLAACIVDFGAVQVVIVAKVIGRMITHRMRPIGEVYVRRGKTHDR